MNKTMWHFTTFFMYNNKISKERETYDVYI